MSSPVLLPGLIATMTCLRPWNGIPIDDKGEPLVPLVDLVRLEPHPYLSLGAPYGPQACPFRLRRGVMERLVRAQEGLQRRHSHCHLAIFDAWRPVAVQAFMVNHATRQECEARGLDPDGSGPQWEAVGLEVGRFWAPPSLNPATPPPHSTGAAVDLTLADADGRPLEMGGAIDAMGPISEPDHYAWAAREDPDSEAAFWHGRRVLLAAVMQEVGFMQHPNEWWHFSYGDQLWAWRQGCDRAHYGRIGAAALEG